jgi:hypothetical protein
VSVRTVRLSGGFYKVAFDMVKLPKSYVRFVLLLYVATERTDILLR